MSQPIYYAARPFCNKLGDIVGFQGVVYTYDDTGEFEVKLYTSLTVDQKEDAIDLAAEWLDDHDLEGELA